MYGGGVGAVGGWNPGGGVGVGGLGPGKHAQFEQCPGTPKTARQSESCSHSSPVSRLPFPHTGGTPGTHWHPTQVIGCVPMQSEFDSQASVPSINPFPHTGGGGVHGLQSSSYIVSPDSVSAISLVVPSVGITQVLYVPSGWQVSFPKQLRSTPLSMSPPVVPAGTGLPGAIIVVGIVGSGLMKFHPDPAGCPKTPMFAPGI